MARSLNSRRAAAEKAAEWFVRLRDDHLGPEQRRSYERWLNRSPVHRAEMASMWRTVRLLHDSDLKGGAPKTQPPSNIIECPPPAPSSARRFWSTWLQILWNRRRNLLARTGGTFMTGQIVSTRMRYGM